MKMNSSFNGWPEKLERMSTEDTDITTDIICGIIAATTPS
jgi:hypothetical protein